MTRDDFEAALAEALNFVTIYGDLPSDCQPVSDVLAIAEAVALRGDYLDIGGVTGKGEAFLRDWAVNHDRN